MRHKRLVAELGYAVVAFGCLTGYTLGSQSWLAVPTFVLFLPTSLLTFAIDRFAYFPFHFAFAFGGHTIPGFWTVYIILMGVFLYLQVVFLRLVWICLLKACAKLTRAGQV